MNAEIIGVGAALASPEALSQAARAAAQELAGCGVVLQSQTSVGADPQRLREAVARALKRSQVVLLLGGLGAGADGITKETVCQGLGRQLVLHQESLARIKAAYQRAGRQMPQQIARLAMLPERSVVFPGVRGITPGCGLAAGNQFILMLPDDPREFLPILQRSVIPYLAKFAGAGAASRTVNVFGLGQAQLRERLGSMLAAQNPTVELAAARGEFTVRVAAKAATQQEAAQLCASVVQEIRRRLGPAAYGLDQREGLAGAALAALEKRGLTLSLAEGGLDGCTAALLERLPQAGEWVRFSVSAGTAALKRDALRVPEKLLKKQGEVSAPVAAAMAAGARDRGESDLGLAVTGALGGREGGKPTGRALIALYDGRQVWVRELSLSKKDPPQAQQLAAALSALALVRQYAASPQPLPGGVALEAALAGKADPGDALPQPPAGGGEPPHGPKNKRPFLAKIFPWRGDPVGEVARKLVLLVALCVFGASAGYLVNYQLQQQRQTGLEEELREMYNTAAGLDPDTPVEVPDGYPEGYQAKFASLYEANSDVAGWLSIDGTQVNYPVVHYQDNEYYLRRDFNRQDSKYGTPWLEAANHMDPQDDNYVIYAHNMTDGKMFGELMNYKGAAGTRDFANPQVGIEYLREHPIISFDDVYRDNDYKIVSVFITNAKEAYGEIFFYNTYLDLSNQADFDTFVSEITARSYYTSNIDIQPGDKFVTLSTCSYEFGPVSDDAHVRTVVVGRRVREGEANDGSDITYGVNENVKLPPGFTGGNTAQLEQQADQESHGTIAMTPENTSSALTASSYQPVSSLPAASGEASTGSTAGDSGQAAQLRAAVLGAMEEARQARDEAEEYEQEAREASSARRAWQAADGAYDAAQDARDAYDRALDLLDRIEALYDQHPTQEAEAAWEAAEEAVYEAQGYLEDAQAFADWAQQAAQELEEEQPSSSEEASSSSQPEPSSSEEQPSSSQEQSSSSRPQPSSSEEQPSSSQEQPSSSEEQSSSSQPEPEESQPQPSSSQPEEPQPEPEPEAQPAGEAGEADQQSLEGAASAPQPAE